MGGGQFYFRSNEASVTWLILQSLTERNTHRKEMRQEAQQWKKQLRVNHTHMRAHAHFALRRCLGNRKS